MLNVVTLSDGVLNAPTQYIIELHPIYRQYQPALLEAANLITTIRSWSSNSSVLITTAYNNTMLDMPCIEERAINLGKRAWSFMNDIDILREISHDDTERLYRNLIRVDLPEYRKQQNYYNYRTNSDIIVDTFYYEQQPIL